MHQSLDIDQQSLEIDQRAGIVKFRALSYIWGPEYPTHKILIDGKPFLVRESLWQFLRRLRWCEDLLWANAICIKQDDAKEKTEQVAMMGAIFSAASTVIVRLEKRQMTASWS